MPSRRQSRQTGPLYLANSITSSYVAREVPSELGQVRFTVGRPSSRLLTTIRPGLRDGINQTRRFLGGRQPLCGMGVTSLIARTSIPAVARARTADSRPEPGPGTRTSTVRIPVSFALLAAVRDAC